MYITIYHTRDLEKISELISLTLKKDSKGSFSMGRPLGDILNINIQDDALVVGLQSLCLPVGHEALKVRGKKIFMYRAEKEAYVCSSLGQEHFEGEHLGMVIADIFAIHDGFKPVNIGDKSSQGMNVIYGHLDFMLVGFNEKKPAYKLLKDFFSLRLGFRPAKVPRDKLEDYKHEKPYSDVFLDNSFIDL